MNLDKNDKKILIAATGALLLVVIFLLTETYTLEHPNFNLTSLTSTSNISLLPIFLTGLLTGGLTCLAVQGGLLASTIAMQEEEKLILKSKKANTALPILTFLTSKLISYTLLGFLLGLFGSLFQLSLTAQIIMQLVIVVFMFGTAANILELHPLFRYFAIQPPKFLTKRLRNQSKSKSVFAPAILGALTIFIPCGTTQAMMALAIGSGKPLLGALIMFAFILGTSPLFFILGFFATKLGDTYQQRFMKIAAIVLILLAIFNLKNTLTLAGINLNLNLSSNVGGTNETATQNPTIEFTSSGYSPRLITVKAGSVVNLTLSNTSGAGCIQSFVIPKLKIQKIVTVGSKETVQFTAPADKGEIPFMCGMGMYTGKIKII